MLFHQGLHAREHLWPLFCEVSGLGWIAGEVVELCRHVVLLELLSHRLPVACAQGLLVSVLPVEELVLGLLAPLTVLILVTWIFAAWILKDDEPLEPMPGSVVEGEPQSSPDAKEIDA